MTKPPGQPCKPPPVLFDWLCSEPSLHHPAFCLFLPTMSNQNEPFYLRY